MERRARGNTGSSGREGERENERVGRKRMIGENGKGAMEGRQRTIGSVARWREKKVAM